MSNRSKKKRAFAKRKRGFMKRWNPSLWNIHSGDLWDPSILDPSLAPDWSPEHKIQSRKPRSGLSCHDVSSDLRVPRSRTDGGSLVYSDLTTSTYMGVVTDHLSSWHTNTRRMSDVKNSRHYVSSPCDSFRFELNDSFKNHYVPTFSDNGIVVSLSQNFYANCLEITDSGNFFAPTGHPYPSGYLDWYNARSYRDSLAWMNMRPTLNKCSTHILEFLYELPELKFLWKDWFSTTKNYSLLVDAVTSAKNKTDSLKAIANANLAYQFGLAPFVSDCTNLVNLMVRMRPEMNKWSQEANQWLRRHFRSRPSVFSDAWSQTYTFGGNVPIVVTVCRQLTCQQFNSCITKYSPLNATGMLNNIEKYLSYLGITTDPGVIWDEIPFSFVIDWFHNISSWLHRLAYDPYKVNIELFDFISTIKSTYITTGSFRLNGIDYPIGSGEAVFYNRVLTLPQNYDDIPDGIFQLNQLGLSASLVGQRVIIHR